MLGWFFKKDEEEEINSVEYEIDELVDSCYDYLLGEKSIFFNQFKRGLKSIEELNKELEKYLKDKGINDENIKLVKEEFRRSNLGYGKLEDLINDEDISDIKIISPSNVRIKKLGKRSTSDVKFKDEEEVSKYITKIAVKNSVTVSDVNAIPTFTDKKSNEKFRLRLNISDTYVNSVSHPYLQIRKIPKVKKSVDKLIEEGLFSREQYEYLVEKVKERGVLFFCGKGGSGKTTVMNILLDEIPEDQSGLAIQENEELFSNHPDLMFQTVRVSRGEGKIQYTLKDLSINGLLLDLDWYIISEIKGGEALYWLNAAYTGHACMASIHSHSSKSALNKLIDYMKYESDYSREDLQMMLQRLNIHIFFFKNYNCNEISKLVGYDGKNDELLYEDIYKEGHWIE